MPMDHGDEKQVKRNRTREQIIRDREMSDLRVILGTAEGKRFMWRLLSHCGIHKNPFSTNALAMAEKVGQQNVGRWIEFEILESCPEKYLEMQLDAAKENHDA